MPDPLSEAIALIRAGKKAEARPLLVGLIRAGPQDLAPWLWLAEAAEDDAARIRILEECLRHNPHSTQAQKGLAGLKARAAPPIITTSPAALLQPQAEPTPTP